VGEGGEHVQAVADQAGGIGEVTVLIGVGAVQAELADRAGVDVERRGGARQGHEHQRAAGACHRYGLIEHVRRRGRDEHRVQAFAGRRRQGGFHRILGGQPDRDHRDRGGEAGQLGPADVGDHDRARAQVIRH
jgi:hypothetical protein